MTPPVRPEPAGDPAGGGGRVARRIAALRQQGATDADVEAYLTQVEGLTPEPASSPDPSAADSLRRAGFDMQRPAPPRTPQPLPAAPGVAAEATGSRLGSRPTPTRGPLEYASDVAQAGAQGATFGFWDEINGTAQSLALRAVGAKIPRQELVDAERQRLAAFRRDAPMASLAAELVGSLAGGAGLGTAVRAVPAGARLATGLRQLGQGSTLARGAKVLGSGAVAGAVGGAGAAEEGQRLRGAATGALFGAGAAGALGTAGAVASPLVRALAPRPAAASRGGRFMRAIGGQTAEDAALADVRKQLGRGRMTTEQLADAAQSAHPEEMLLDVGGEAMAARAGGAVATPSRGSVDIRNALEGRRGALPQTVRRETSRALGTNRENQAQLADDLIRQRRDAAAPLYERAYAAPPIEDPDVLAVFKDEAFQDAYTTAQRLARREGVTLPPSLTREVEVGGQKITEQVPIPVQGFDYVKRAMDDVIERRINSGAIGRTEARQLRNMLDDALGRVDEAVPDYKAARAQYAGDSALMDAQETGRQFLREDSDELLARWPKLSEGEQAMYRRGAIAAIEDAVQGRTDAFNPTTRFRNDIVRQKLRTIIPDPTEADRLTDMLERIHGMHTRSQGILGNSKTAERLAQQADAAGPAGEILGATLTGNPLSLASYGLRAGLKQRLQGLTEQQVDALAPLLTAKGDELRRVIQLLQAAEREGLSRPRLSGTRAGAQVAGGAAGSSTNSTSGQSRP